MVILILLLQRRITNKQTICCVSASNLLLEKGRFVPSDPMHQDFVESKVHTCLN
jgi:hypothetical protein